jgi:hypothetical protein
MPKPEIGFERGIDPNEYVIKLDKKHGGFIINHPERLVIKVEEPYEGVLPLIEDKLRENPMAVGRSYLPRATVYVGDKLAQASVLLRKPLQLTEKEDSKN